MGTFKTVGNFYSTSRNGQYTVSPQLMNTIKAAAAVSPYNVEVFAGMREGGAPNHQYGHAVDIYLVNPETGVRLTNYQGPGWSDQGYQGTWRQNFPAYEQFAQTVKVTMQHLYPGDPVNNLLRWGGYFPPGKYSSVPDLMHFDITPGARGSAGAGTIAGGMDSRWQRYWGVQSSGMNPRFADQVSQQLAGGAPTPPAPVPMISMGQRMVEIAKASGFNAADATAFDPISGAPTLSLSDWTDQPVFNAGLDPNTNLVRLFDDPHQAMVDSLTETMNRSDMTPLQKLDAITTTAAVASTFPARPDIVSPNETQPTFPARPDIVSPNNVAPAPAPVSGNPLYAGLPYRPRTAADNVSDFYRNFGTVDTFPARPAVIAPNGQQALAAIKGITAQVSAAGGLAPGALAGGAALVPSLHGPLMVYVPPLSAVPDPGGTRNPGAAYADTYGRSEASQAGKPNAPVQGPNPEQAPIPANRPPATPDLVLPQPGWDPITGAPVWNNAGVGFSIETPDKAHNNAVDGAARDFLIGHAGTVSQVMGHAANVFGNFPTFGFSDGVTGQAATEIPMSVYAPSGSQPTRAAPIPMSQPNQGGGFTTVAYGRSVPAIGTSPDYGQMNSSSSSSSNSIPDWAKSYSAAIPRSPSSPSSNSLSDQAAKLATYDELNASTIPEYIHQTTYSKVPIYSAESPFSNPGHQGLSPDDRQLANDTPVYGSNLSLGTPLSADQARQIIGYKTVANVNTIRNPAFVGQQNAERAVAGQGAVTGAGFIDAATGAQLFPQQTLRLNPVTNRFDTVTVYRPAAAHTAASVAANQNTAAAPKIGGFTPVPSGGGGNPTNTSGTETYVPSAGGWMSSTNHDTGMFQASDGSWY